MKQAWVSVVLSYPHGAVASAAGVGDAAPTTFGAVVLAATVGTVTTVTKTPTGAEGVGSQLDAT